MWEYRNWSSTLWPIPSEARRESMNHEEKTLDIRLIVWIEVEYSSKVRDIYLARSRFDIFEELRIGIGINDRIMIDLIVWAPCLREGDDGVFFGAPKYFLDISLHSLWKGIRKKSIKHSLFKCIDKLWISRTESMLHIRAHIWISKCEKSGKKHLPEDKPDIIFLSWKQRKHDTRMRYKGKMIEWANLSNSWKSIPPCDRKTWKDWFDEERKIIHRR